MTTFKPRKKEFSRKNNFNKTDKPVRERPSFAREGAAIQGEIQSAVLRITPEEVAAWAASELGVDKAPTYQTAKTLIASYIEFKLRIRYGVYFTERRGKLSLQVGWMKSSPMSIEPPKWVQDHLDWYPRPVWTIDTSALIELPIE